MRAVVLERIEENRHRFDCLVLPVLDTMGLGGEWELTEDRDGISRELDMRAGVDAWWYDESRVRAVSLRIQPQSVVWRTFTIRAHKRNGAMTELQKYRRAIDEELLYPHWHVQAYLDARAERVTAIGAARLRDIMAMIDDGCYYERRNTQDGTVFYVINWDKMHERGLHVAIWPPENANQMQLLLVGTDPDLAELN